jgi:protein NrfD
MTAVFYLFLFHSSVGLVAALPFVTRRAGARFFKLCSAAAVFMTTSALWLLYRRYGDGPVDLRGLHHGATPMLLASGSLLAMVLYNRAEHFGWRRLRMPLVTGAIAAGVLAIAAGAPPDQRALVLAADLSSALLVGTSAAAMILGHYYLIVLDLPISALRRLTLLLGAALVLRTLVVGFAVFGSEGDALSGARLVATGLWSPDGIFVWMRFLFGLVGPASLIGFIWKTVEIRSTQSATGILYVQLFLILAGELLAKYLRIVAGFPL